MQKQYARKPTTKRSNLPKFITLTLIVIITIFAVSLLPRGFSDDTSLIGQGTSVLVLVHDDNILQSGETMAVMNAIRDDYEDRLAFIVADINTPEGKTFADRNALMPTALVFYSASGGHLQTLYSAQTVASLRQELSKVFQY